MSPVDEGLRDALERVTALHHDSNHRNVDVGWRDCGYAICGLARDALASTPPEGLDEVQAHEPDCACSACCFPDRRHGERRR